MNTRQVYDEYFHMKYLCYCSGWNADRLIREFTSKGFANLDAGGKLTFVIRPKPWEVTTMVREYGEVLSISAYKQLFFPRGYTGLEKIKYVAMRAISVGMFLLALTVFSKQVGSHFSEYVENAKAGVSRIFR